MDYSKMSDHEINYAVGLMNQVRNGYYITPRDYCNSWADAGPIIAENCITLAAPMRYEVEQYWMAYPSMNSDLCAQDVNPLRAAMIVYLMMHDKGEE